MIKVIVKETEYEKNAVCTRLVVKEHKDATKAWVHNGVLSLYPASANNIDFGQAIGGYEAGSWEGWEKVEVEALKQGPITLDQLLKAGLIEEAENLLRETIFRYSGDAQTAAKSAKRVLAILLEGGKQ